MRREEVRPATAGKLEEVRELGFRKVGSQDLTETPGR